MTEDKPGSPPVSPLDMDQFVVKEHVGLLKLTDTFDILDPKTQQRVAIARETPGGFIKFLRLLVNKRMLPTEVTVTLGDESGPLLFRIRRPFTFLRSRVSVYDEAGVEIGYFKSKMFSLGGGFWVYDVQDNLVAEIKGDWKGWNFKFLGPGGEEIGLVTKKWGESPRSSSRAPTPTWFRSQASRAEARSRRSFFWPQRWRSTSSSRRKDRGFSYL